MEVAPQRIWFTAEQTSAHWSDVARDKVQSGSLDIRIIRDAESKVRIIIINNAGFISFDNL
jgi:hypothetical protein